MAVHGLLVRRTSGVDGISSDRKGNQSYGTIDGKSIRNGWTPPLYHCILGLLLLSIVAAICIFAVCGSAAALVAGAAAAVVATTRAVSFWTTGCEIQRSGVAEVQPVVIASDSAVRKASSSACE